MAPVQPILGKTSEQAKVAAMRTTVAQLASALARALKRATSGTLRRKKLACITAPKSIVCCAMVARCAGNLNSVANTQWPIGSSAQTI